MSAADRNLLVRFSECLNGGEPEAAQGIIHPEVRFDWSRSIAPYRDMVWGRDGFLVLLRDFLDAWEEWHWELERIEELPGASRYIVSTRVRGRGKGSGVEIDAHGAQLVEVADGCVSSSILFQSRDDAAGYVAREPRVEWLNRAHLYFVCEGRPAGGDPDELLNSALEGGVDVIQLREKAPRCAEEIVALAEPFRRAADAHGALFVLNDQPELVAACGADGVHVGQDDTPVAEARAQAGMAAVVGLSTHTPAQFDAAITARGDSRPDQVSAGPVWETPTKEGRPAAGIELIRHAATAGGNAPWFAIGGIDLTNVGEIAAAGACRVVVVRAIRDAADPAHAARQLRAALAARVLS